MSVRLAIVEVDLASVNVSKFCREHGICRDTLYEIRKRYAAEGLAGLEPRSRAPHHVANRIRVEVEDLIVELRKELDDQGLDAGPASIQYWLARRVPPDAVCSESTIWRVLTRRGFIVPDASKAPGRRWRSFAAARGNECWQMDSTGWFLADDTRVDIISALDDCSRTALACRATLCCNTPRVWETITDAAERYGWPEWVLTDNAKYFGDAFAENLAALGVDIGHSRPYHPQTCGKVERFQQTLKKWLAAHDPAATLAELQDELDAFVTYYNTQRPHRSLGRRTPHDVWHTTPHSGPANQPVGRPTTMHRNHVYDGIVWAGRYRITLGAQHNGHEATIITTGDRCHVFINGRLIRELTINPDRPGQPLHNRPGRPTT